MNDEICKGVSDTKMLHRYRYHHTDIGADTDADTTSIIYFKKNFFKQPHLLWAGVATGKYPPVQ